MSAALSTVRPPVSSSLQWETEQGLSAAHRLRQEGKPAAALALYRQIIADDPQSFPALVGIGVALQAGCRTDEAITALETAVSIEPASFAAQYNLAFALAEGGRVEAAVEAYRRALAIEPQSPAALVNLGTLLKGQGRLSEAIAAFREATRVAPDLAAAQMSLAAALFDDGQLRECLAAARLAIEAEPGNADTYVLQAEALLELDEVETAEAVCRRALQLQPGHSGALAYLAILLQRLGRHDEARRLLDYERLLKIEPLREVKGWPSVAAWNAVLEFLALRRSDLTAEPAGKATEEGLQSGEIFGSDQPALQTLRAEIERVVGDYLATVVPSASLGLPWPAPKKHHLTGRAVVLNSGRRQRSHVHPSAFLSGVYYVRVPDVVRSGHEGDAGCLRFGEPWAGWPRGRANGGDFLTTSVRPEDGLLVLFPSYFRHHTVPFSSHQHRISIAVDVIPQP